MILYYFILFVAICWVVGMHFIIEMIKIDKSIKEGNKKDRCVYCHLPVGNRNTISYGWPGKLQIIKCKRWWCDLGKNLGYLIPKDYEKRK
jgi:hypothetical protein